MVRLLFALVFAHFLCDYPLQGDFIGKLKCRRAPRLGILIPWWHLMTAHAFIHAGAVLLLTGSLACAALELVVHFVIDCLKCEGEINIHVDQLLHIICKVGYVIYLMR